MEATQTFNGIIFEKMVRAGAANLRAHVDTVNDLNVFPIPDGDTGSNMLLTITGGVNGAEESTESLGETARRISDGMLLSARGNSGVILSQIFDGIAEGFSDVAEANSQDFVKALQEGVRHSYSAVMEPTEGTILTVMRCATEYISDNVKENIPEMLEDFLQEAINVLKKTPDMLPVLKKADVVDSGGAGLVCIIEGALQALEGKEIETEMKPKESDDQKLNLDLFTEDSVLEYGYCTELLLRLQRSKTDPESLEVSTLTEYLKGIGDSVVAFKTGSIVKIHIHTMTPDRVLAFCQRYGEFLKIKIENMSLQHNNITVETKDSTVKDLSKRKKYGLVAVASGVGVKQLFYDGGADVVVDGGQSMNPSTEDFMRAFQQVNADTIFVLPNNGNIILAAKQAASMFSDSDVRVIESYTIGDGYAALSMFTPDSEDTDQMVCELTDAMQGVITAEISQSVRDAQGVKAGEYIGFVGKEIIAAKEKRLDAVYETIDKLNVSKYDVVILIRGIQTDEMEMSEVEKYINTHYTGKEIYVVDGMQEIYDYIMILE